MDFLIYFLIFLIVAIFLLFFRRRQRQSAFNEKLRSMGIAENQVNLSDEILSSLAQSGFALEAIKIYRNRTGKGLKESKEDIMKLIIGEKPQKTTLVLPSIHDEENKQVIQLIRDGKMIEAIAYVREKKGLSLSEAKSLVDSLRFQSGI